MCCQALEYPKVDEVPVLTKLILMIDDEVDQTEVLARCLARQGFETISAHTLEEGRKLAKEHRPDLILLDIHLPDGNGIDLCREFDESRTISGTPVILLSAVGESDLIRRIRAAGGKYFMRKPYDPNVLLLLIHQQLGQGANGAW